MSLRLSQPPWRKIVFQLVEEPTIDRSFASRGSGLQEFTHLQLTKIAGKRTYDPDRHIIPEREHKI